MALVGEDGTHPDAGTKEVSVDNAPPVVVIDEVLNEMGSEDLLAGLTAVAEEVSGRDLSRFFDAWLYREPVPEFRDQAHRSESRESSSRA